MIPGTRGAKSAATKLGAAEKPTPVEKISKRTGKSKTAIKRDIERGEEIDPDVLNEISGTELDNGAYLDELKKTPKPGQPAKVAKDKKDKVAAKARPMSKRAKAASETLSAAPAADLAAPATIKIPDPHPINTETYDYDDWDQAKRFFKSNLLNLDEAKKFAEWHDVSAIILELRD